MAEVASKRPARKGLWFMTTVCSVVRITQDNKDGQGLESTNGNAINYKDTEKYSHINPLKINSQ